MEDPLQFTITIQRNLHQDTFQVNLTILLCNPLESPRRQELLFRGKLCPESIRFHAPASVWWPPENLDDALQMLKRLALHWFDEWGKVAFLAEKFELSIRENRSLIEVLEPTDQDTFNRVWHQVATPRQVTPMTYYHASVLHFLAGHTEKARERTADWLASLDPGQKDERARAEAQLATLNRVH